jgi:hypothetical protein
MLRLLGDQRNSSLVALSWRNSNGLFKSVSFFHPNSILGVPYR